MANLTQGDPETKGRQIVFDPAVFGRTEGQLRDYNSARKEWDDTYDKFKTDWASGQGVADSNAKQEGSFLDKFYNGDFAGYLSGLRAREADAKRAAGDRALEFARGATDRASLVRGEPTGTSSATRAMAYRLSKDVENDVALNGINRERGDFDYLNRSQQAFMGRRTALADAVKTRQLLPHQLNNAELMAAIQQLGGIQALRNGSSSPEFYKDLDTIQRVAGTFDTVVDTAGNLVSAYGGGGYKSGADTGAGAMPQAPQATSVPYSAQVSYANPPVSGGTTFNYSTPSTPAATGGYGAGMQYSQPAPASTGWQDYGMHY